MSTEHYQPICSFSHNSQHGSDSRATQAQPNAINTGQHAHAPSMEHDSLEVFSPSGKDPCELYTILPADTWDRAAAFREQEQQGERKKGDNFKFVVAYWMREHHCHYTHPGRIYTDLQRSSISNRNKDQRTVAGFCVWLVCHYVPICLPRRRLSGGFLACGQGSCCQVESGGKSRSPVRQGCEGVRTE